MTLRSYWAELAEGVTEEFYVGGLRPPRAEKPAFGRTVRRNDGEPPPDGWTEAIMIAHGFSIEQMVERVR